MVYIFNLFPPFFHIVSSIFVKFCRTYCMSVVYSSSDLQSGSGCFVHLTQCCLHLKKLFLTANRLSPIYHCSCCSISCPKCLPYLFVHHPCYYIVTVNLSNPIRPEKWQKVFKLCLLRLLCSAAFKFY